MKLRWAVMLGCAWVLACGDDGDGADEEGDDGPLGMATGAVCDSTLTYEKDIKLIADTFCVNCHAKNLTGAARHDAPSDHNFDTAAGILEEKTHVDETAGSGPNVTNTIMPIAGYPAPTKEQRAKLSQWLACPSPK